MKPQRSTNPFRRELDIIRRCRHWQLVIEAPASVYPDAAVHEYVAARYRRDAQRNLSKLLKNHPQIAERLERENSEVTASVIQ